ncbi:MAG: aminotransferase class I/II-fold pyridoxal phosphate-dependent enzyme [Clostridia bacterium]|nr:aminotransferase class I/II-fold pyridoxal phosphate-dependent enzyme [Clostridia bacterium]
MNYDSLLNRTALRIPPSGIRRFFDIAAEMEDVISLSVGEPDFPTPWHVRDVAIDSLQKGRTGYSPNRGFTALCREICGYYSRRFGLDYDFRSEIVVTVGGSEAIDLAIRTLVNPGDEVLVPQPSFVCYDPIARLAGARTVPLVTRREDEFRLTAQALRERITDRTRLLILPFPNNPTGAVMRREHLEEIAAVLRGTDIFVLADEIYSELTYNGQPHVSIASLDGMKERTVVVNGFSKSYAMTGWRLGYALGPAPIIAVMTKVHQYAIMCAPTTSQHAAIEALRNGDEDILKMRDEYDMRRRLIVRGFRELGLDCFEPEGAFYVFPSIAATGLTSEEFCERLLREKHVAVVPGNAFGVCGEGFIRVSYAYSTAHINEALRRIGQFLKENNLL